MNHHTKVYVYIFILPLLIFGCKPYTSLSDVKIQENEVLAIKFMGSISTQPHQITDKEFWRFPDEHVFLKIRNDDFVKHIKKLPNNGGIFNEAAFAIIYKTGKKKDTIYSDSDLRNWYEMENNKRVYYYDEKQEIAKSLQENYSFFRRCW